MKVRKLVSIVMVIIIVFTIIPLNKLGTNALTVNEIESKMTLLKTQYYNGSVWKGTNGNSSSGAYIANDGSSGPWECFGFGCEIFRALFGCEMPRAYKSDKKYVYTNTSNVVLKGTIDPSYNSSTVKNLLSQAKVGDIIQACSSTSQHTMVVNYTTEYGISVFDANSNGQNGIRTDAYYTWDDFYNYRSRGISLYSYSNYPASTEPSNVVNSNYPTPISAYTVSTGNVTTYRSVNGSEAGHITGSTDLCTINQVYTNDWVCVTYPTSSGPKTAYTYLSNFVPSTNAVMPYCYNPSATKDAYIRSDLSTKFGSIWTTDNCMVVAKSGTVYQLIYPVDSGGYKLGWIETYTAPAPTPSQSYPTPITAYIASATNRANTYSSIGAAWDGISQIFVDDRCTINAVYDSGWVYVNYPISGGTKNAYAYLSDFIPTSTAITRYTATVTAQSTAYRKSNMSVELGWVDAGDEIIVVGKSGSNYQVMYPVSAEYGGGYKLGWIYGTYISQVMTGLTITSKPTTLTYIEGTSLNTSGLVVTATYADGTSANVTSSCSLSGYSSTPGIKTIVMAYNGYTASFTVTVNAKTATSISIVSQPTKINYYVGDEFNSSGLIVRANYNNDTTAFVTEYDISGFSSEAAGTKSITVAYSFNGVILSDFFDVNVTEVAVTGIAVKTNPSIMSYYVGDTLDTEGLTLIATYNNGTTSVISSGFSCSPSTLSTSGTQTITVTYSGKTTTFNVTVLAVTLSSISVKSNPSRVSYDVGDLLDTTGLSLTATYSDDSTETITSGFACTPTTLMTAGTQIITVSYGDKSTEFTVTVEEPNINAAKFVVSSPKANVGQTVTVTVSVENNPGIIAARLSIGYDATKLQLTGVVSSGLIGGTFTAGNDISANPYTVLWEDGLASNNYTGNGVMATYTFLVLENAALGVTPITVSYDQGSTFNCDMEDVEFALENGSIEITDRTPGDANDDGLVNLKDVAVIRRYLAGGWDVTINNTNADVNADGEVNLKDVVLINRYLAGGWGVILV